MLFKTSLPLLCCAVASFGFFTEQIEVAGEHENPNEKFGKLANFKLVGDTQFGWRTNEIVGNIDLNGRAFLIDTGGGNFTRFSGVLSGPGEFEWKSGGVPQVAPSIIGGTEPNRLSGTFILSKGILDLEKPANTDAISCDLLIGKIDRAIVRLKNDEQISNQARITFSGNEVAELHLNGHVETVGEILLETDSVIDFGNQIGSLTVADSQQQAWKSGTNLIIRGMKQGTKPLRFGTSGNGLSPQQLSQVGIELVEGDFTSLYSAKLDNEGYLIVDKKIEAQNPPYAISSDANKERSQLYGIEGLKTLCSEGTPLKPKSSIRFFGDSITWQNGYIQLIERSLTESSVTHDFGITLHNHGINGGGVLQLRDGSNEGGYPGNSKQAPFKTILESGPTDIVVVFIGINDVWWRKTSQEDFEKGLSDLISSIKEHHATPVICTLTLHDELPDGNNPDDPKIEEYAELTRKVVKSHGATLVDLRKAYVAYLQNHNSELRVDGSLRFRKSGFLTYDGVHPNEAGVTLLANLISDGIVRSLAK